MGGVRTALFNYLFAKKHGGDFILRIEDTDQVRYVEGAEEYIMKSLEWVGIEIDEGVRDGGKYAPYKQSERREIYKEYIQKLIDSGHAYYAFDTPDELEEMRKRLEESGSSNRQYNAETRISMRNSFTMSPEEVKERIKSGIPYVIRFKLPEKEFVKVIDLIRGEVVVNTSQLDDKVLFKSDGLPTYHLANIVDDRLMKISHVIRGEEWLPSLPLHVLLYRSFGWEEEMPKFAHLPLLLKPNGKGKLSKRDGDQLGFPVFPLEWKDPDTGEIYSGYKEAGYLPEAFINLLALLGWNPGDEQEILSMHELIKKFDLEKVQKGGARFSPEKAKWFNQQHIIQSKDEELRSYILPVLVERKIQTDVLYLEKVIGLVKERMTLLGDFWEQACFFFESPSEYNQKSAQKHFKENTPQILLNVYDILEGIRVDKFTTEHTEELIKIYIDDNELNFGSVLNPLRLVLTGTGGGPHLFDIISTIGKEETLKRILAGIAAIKKA